MTTLSPKKTLRRLIGLTRFFGLTVAKDFKNLKDSVDVKMREVLNLVSGGGPGGGGPGGGGPGGPGPALGNNNNSVDKSDDANNNNCVDDNSVVATAATDAEDAADAAAAIVKMLSSQPGYLELSEDRAKELLSERPIEELYEVEEQPFAR